MPSSDWKRNCRGMMAGKRRSARVRTRGVFITFEGVEGSGKSTQCAHLAIRLREEGYTVLETREPGGTPLAERVRDVLLAASSDEPITPACEAHLVFAARSQHVATVIRPALEQGIVVLCDRFMDSTLAYQGYGRGLDLADLRRMNRLATGGLAPSMTCLFDMPVEPALARRKRQGQPLNRLDRETLEFHRRVRQGFKALAKREPRRIAVFDGRASIDDLAALVAEAARPHLAHALR